MLVLGRVVSPMCISVTAAVVGDPLRNFACVMFCVVVFPFLGLGWLVSPLFVSVVSATLGVQFRGFACSSGVSVVISPLLGLG